MDKILTIDGPSASGKGSLTRAIAIALNFNVLDSGLLYRAYAYFYEKALLQIILVKKFRDYPSDLIQATFKFLMI